MGVDPTDKEVVFTATFTARLNGGKIEEQWVNFDTCCSVRIWLSLRKSPREEMQGGGEGAC